MGSDSAQRGAGSSAGWFRTALLSVWFLSSSVSSSSSTYSLLAWGSWLREMSDNAWQREVRSVRVEGVGGSGLVGSSSLIVLTLVMLILDMQSSSSPSSVFDFSMSVLISRLSSWMVGLTSSAAMSSMSSSVYRLAGRSGNIPSSSWSLRDSQLAILTQDQISLSTASS